MSTLLASQIDLSVIWKILQMISKFVVINIFFPYESLKTCGNIASNSLETIFFFLEFVIANSKTKPNTLI